MAGRRSGCAARRSSSRARPIRARICAAASSGSSSAPASCCATTRRPARVSTRCCSGSTEHVVTHYADDLTAVISSTVQRWDTEETSRRLELQVGSRPPVHPHQRHGGRLAGRPGDLRAQPAVLTRRSHDRRDSACRIAGARLRAVRCGLYQFGPGDPVRRPCSQLPSPSPAPSARCSPPCRPRRPARPATQAAATSAVGPAADRRRRATRVRPVAAHGSASSLPQPRGVTGPVRTAAAGEHQYVLPAEVRPLLGSPGSVAVRRHRPVGLRPGRTDSGHLSHPPGRAHRRPGTDGHVPHRDVGARLPQRRQPHSATRSCARGRPRSGPASRRRRRCSVA